MRRNTIEITEHGTVIIPDLDIWMSEAELVSLFGVIALTLRAAIKAVYKNDILKEHEVQKYIRLENGYNADVFSFPMIVALAFRINSFGTEQVRKIHYPMLLHTLNNKKMNSIQVFLCQMIDFQ